MKTPLSKKKYKPSLLLSIFLIIGLSFGLSACSNTEKEKAKPKYKTIQTLNQQQNVETGTVVSVRNIQINPRSVNSRSYSRPSFGIAASSSGFGGVYGSFDVASLSRIFGKKQNAEAQEIIVKKSTGNTVAITQITKEKFKQGETVKIVVRDGQSVVVK